MAKFVIGGEDYEFPPLNLKTIKKVWPLVDKIQGAEGLPELMDVTCEILALVLARSDKPLTADEIEDKMLSTEIDGIRVSMEDLLVESGLLQRVPEGTKTGEAVGAAPLTETGTASSQNSSQQDAAAETGS